MCAYINNVAKRLEKNVLTAKEKKWLSVWGVMPSFSFSFSFITLLLCPPTVGEWWSCWHSKPTHTGAKKAEKTYSGTHITHKVYSTECNHHLIPTPSLPELKLSAVYCFCPSLCTCLENMPSPGFSFSFPPSFSPSLLLTHSLTHYMEVKEDKQSLSTDIWSSRTQFGIVQSFLIFFFFIREHEEKK